MERMYLLRQKIAVFLAAIACVFLIQCQSDYRERVDTADADDTILQRDATTNWQEDRTTWRDNYNQEVEEWRVYIRDQRAAADTMTGEQRADAQRRIDQAEQRIEEGELRVRRLDEADTEDEVYEVRGDLERFFDNLEREFSEMGFERRR